jgi:hypothetical protein
MCLYSTSLNYSETVSSSNINAERVNFKRRFGFESTAPSQQVAVTQLAGWLYSQLPSCIHNWLQGDAATQQVHNEILDV